MVDGEIDAVLALRLITVTKTVKKHGNVKYVAKPNHVLPNSSSDRVKRVF